MFIVPASVTVGCAMPFIDSCSVLPVLVISYSLNAVTSTPENASVTLVDAELVTRIRDVVSSSIRLLSTLCPANLNDGAGYLAANFIAKSPDNTMDDGVSKNLPDSAV
jgi:hypothetical protein